MIPLSSSTDKANSNIPDNFWSVDVNAATSAGADPYLLAAIAQHETQFGTLGAGQEGYALGYGYPAPGQGNPMYKGLDNQLFYAGLQVNEFFSGGGAAGSDSLLASSVPVTPDSLYQFALTSWKPGASADPVSSAANAKAWANSVWSIYSGYTKDSSLTKDNSTIAKVGGVVNTVKAVTSNAGSTAYFATMVILALVGIFFFVRIWSK